MLKFVAVYFFQTSQHEDSSTKLEVVRIGLPWKMWIQHQRPKTICPILVMCFGVWITELFIQNSSNSIIVPPQNASKFWTFLECPRISWMLYRCRRHLRCSTWPCTMELPRVLAVTFRDTNGSNYLVIFLGEKIPFKLTLQNTKFHFLSILLDAFCGILLENFASGYHLALRFLILRLLPPRTWWQLRALSRDWRQLLDVAWSPFCVRIRPTKTHCF